MARKKNIVFENDRTVLQPVQFSMSGEKEKAILVPEIDNLDELSSYKSLRRKRIKLAVTRACIWLLSLIILPLMVFLSVMVFSSNKGHNFFGVTYYLVTSDSMEPEINQWDMIVVKSDFTIEDIDIGSDITFLREFDGKIVTHRVTSFEDTESGRMYTTKGVNNIFYDEPVNFNNVLGVKKAVKPILGDIVVFFRSVPGMIVMFSFFGLVMAGIFISFKVSNDIRAVGK